MKLDQQASLAWSAQVRAGVQQREQRARDLDAQRSGWDPEGPHEQPWRRITSMAPGYVVRVARSQAVDVPTWATFAQEITITHDDSRIFMQPRPITPEVRLQIARDTPWAAQWVVFWAPDDRVIARPDTVQIGQLGVNIDADDSWWLVEAVSHLVDGERGVYLSEGQRGNPLRVYRETDDRRTDSNAPPGWLAAGMTSEGSDLNNRRGHAISGCTLLRFTRIAP